MLNILGFPGTFPQMGAPDIKPLHPIEALPIYRSDTAIASMGTDTALPVYKKARP